jgi:hypothetical protein
MRALRRGKIRADIGLVRFQKIAVIADGFAGLRRLAEIFLDFERRFGKG